MFDRFCAGLHPAFGKFLARSRSLGEKQPQGRFLLLWVLPFNGCGLTEISGLGCASGDGRGLCDLLCTVVAAAVGEIVLKVAGVVFLRFRRYTGKLTLGLAWSCRGPRLERGARRCRLALPGATHDTNRRNPNAEGTTAVWSGTCGLLAVCCVLCCATAVRWFAVRAGCGGRVPIPARKRLPFH